MGWSHRVQIWMGTDSYWMQLRPGASMGHKPSGGFLRPLSSVLDQRPPEADTDKILQLVFSSGADGCEDCG